MSAALVRLLSRHFARILAACALVQAIVLVALRPGVLSIDEATYLAMADGAAHGRLLEIANGWELGASTELESMLVREVGGRLVAQYPPGFALLAAPLERVLGGGALFVLNTAAFYLTVWLTRRIARRVLGTERGALLAAGIYALGTFAWEYGAAIWPHAITTFLTCAAVDCALARRRFAAGLLVGLALTIRLDAMFVVPALLVVPLVLEPKTASWRDSGALLAGLGPGLALLAVSNHAKFGTWQPLSYGPWQGEGSHTGASSYVALGAAAVLGLVALHVAARHAARIDRRMVGAALALTAAGLLLVPGGRTTVLQTLDGVWMLVVDLRIRDAAESALTRSPRNAMIYVGTLKTSLAQSCPYLALAVLALAGGRRRVAIALPIATYIVVFGAFHWHGGLSVNLRYFTPFLPLLAILAADGLTRLARQASLHALRVADVVLLASAAVYIGVVVALGPDASLPAREIFYLDVPLVLAALLTITSGATLLLGRGPVRAHVASGAFVLGLVTIVWAGLTELTYHAVAVGRVRSRAHAATEHAAVPAGALLVVDQVDPVARLLENGIVFATGSRDGFADAGRLVAAAACARRPAYAILRASRLEQLSAAAPELSVRHVGAYDGLVTVELLGACPR